MSLKNPLAYYTPGIPGRGAGTILKQPDLTGYAARQMKLTDLKLKQKQDEDAKARAEFDKLTQIKGTYSHIIHDEADKEMEEFNKWVLGVISKGNGRISPYDMQEAKIRAKHAENTFAQTIRAESDYEKAQTIITSDYAKGLYDASALEEMRVKIEDEIKKPLKEQNIFSIINAQPRFDLNEYEKKVIIPNIASKATIRGVVSDINEDPSGVKYVRGEKVKVVPSDIARAEYKKEYYQNPLVFKQVNETFNRMMGANPNGFEVPYNEIKQDVNGGVSVDYNQKKLINNVNDFIDYGLAHGKIEKTASLSMGGGSGSNVNVTVSGSGVPQKTNIAASAPASMPYGNVTVYGQKVDANKVIDEKSQLTFTPSTMAYTVEGDTPSAGIVQGGSAMIYPVAKKDIKWSTGAVSKKGTILARPENWSEVDYNSWMDKNKDLYSYSPYILLYNTSAKNTTVDKFSKQESFIKANLGDDYWTEVWRITNEMNGGKPTNTQPQGNTVKPAAKKPNTHGI